MAWTLTNIATTSLLDAQGLRDTNFTHMIISENPIISVPADGSADKINLTGSIENGVLTFTSTHTPSTTRTIRYVALSGNIAGQAGEVLLAQDTANFTIAAGQQVTLGNTIRVGTANQVTVEPMVNFTGGATTINGVQLPITGKLAGRVLKATGSGETDNEWAADTGTAADWAEDGNTDPIPASKLTNAPAGTSAATWAQPSNTDPIPSSKLTNAPGQTASQVSDIINTDTRLTNRLAAKQDTSSINNVIEGVIDQDVEAAANTGNPSTRWTAAKLPTDVVYDDDISAVLNGTGTFNTTTRVLSLNKVGGGTPLNIVIPQGADTSGITSGAAQGLINTSLATFITGTSGIRNGLRFTNPVDNSTTDVIIDLAQSGGAGLSTEDQEKLGAFTIEYRAAEDGGNISLYPASSDVRFFNAEVAGNALSDLSNYSNLTSPLTVNGNDLYITTTEAANLILSTSNTDRTADGIVGTLVTSQSISGRFIYRFSAPSRDNSWYLWGNDARERVVIFNGYYDEANTNRINISANAALITANTTEIDKLRQKTLPLSTTSTTTEISGYDTDLIMTLNQYGIPIVGDNTFVIRRSITPQYGNKVTGSLVTMNNQELIRWAISGQQLGLLATRAGSTSVVNYTKTQGLQVTNSRWRASRAGQIINENAVINLRPIISSGALQNNVRIRIDGSNNGNDFASGGQLYFTFNRNGATTQTQTQQYRILSTSNLQDFTLTMTLDLSAQTLTISATDNNSSLTFDISAGYDVPATREANIPTRYTELELIPRNRLGFADATAKQSLQENVESDLIAILYPEEGSSHGDANPFMSLAAIVNGHITLMIDTNRRLQDLVPTGTVAAAGGVVTGVRQTNELLRSIAFTTEAPTNNLLNGFYNRRDQDEFGLAFHREEKHYTGTWGGSFHVREKLFVNDREILPSGLVPLKNYNFTTTEYDEISRTSPVSVPARGSANPRRFFVLTEISDLSHAEYIELEFEAEVASTRVLSEPVRIELTPQIIAAANAITGSNLVQVLADSGDIIFPRESYDGIRVSLGIDNVNNGGNFDLVIDLLGTTTSLPNDATLTGAWIKKDIVAISAAAQSTVNTADVDARIETWARAGDTTQIPSSKLTTALSPYITDSTARQLISANSDNSIVSGARSGNDIILTREDGTTQTIALPAGRTDAEVNALIQAITNDDFHTASYDAATGVLTFTANDGSTETVTISVGLNETEVRATIANDTALQARLDAKVDDSSLDSDVTTIIGQRVDSFARVGDSSTIPDVKIPATIARDSEIEDWAKDGNTEAIPASKLTNAPSGGLDQAAVDARIETWARAGDTSTIPLAKLPSGTNTGGGGSNNAEIIDSLVIYTDSATQPSKPIITFGREPQVYLINDADDRIYYLDRTGVDARALPATVDVTFPSGFDDEQTLGSVRVVILPGEATERRLNTTYSSMAVVDGTLYAIYTGTADTVGGSSSIEPGELLVIDPSGNLIPTRLSNSNLRDFFGTDYKLTSHNGTIYGATNSQLKRYTPATGQTLSQILPNANVSRGFAVISNNVFLASPDSAAPNTNTNVQVRRLNDLTTHYSFTISQNITLIGSQGNLLYGRAGNFIYAINPRPDGTTTTPELIGSVQNERGSINFNDEGMYTIRGSQDPSLYYTPFSSDNSATIIKSGLNTGFIFNPRGMTYLNGFLYVIESNRQIFRAGLQDGKGIFERVPESGFNLPGSSAFALGAHNGQLYYASGNINGVTLYTVNAETAATTQVGFFNTSAVDETPRSIFSANGNLYIVMNTRAYIYDGSFTPSFGPTSRFRQAAVLDGVIYAPNNTNDPVEVIDTFQFNAQGNPVSTTFRQLDNLGQSITSANIRGLAVGVGNVGSESYEFPEGWQRVSPNPIVNSKFYTEILRKSNNSIIVGDVLQDVGLDQNKVDARVQAGVSDWAETGDTDTIPDAKIADDITRDSEIEDWAKVANPSTTVPTSKIRSDILRTTQVEDWARDGNTDIIPQTKLPAYPVPRTDAEINTLANARINDNTNGYQTAANVGAAIGSSVRQFALLGQTVRIEASDIADNSITEVQLAGSVTQLLAKYKEAVDVAYVASATVPTKPTVTYADATGYTFSGGWSTTIPTATTGQEIYRIFLYRLADDTVVVGVPINNSSGLDADEINALIAAHPIAASQIAAVDESAIPASIARDSEIQDWAKVGDNSQIPNSKIPDALEYSDTKVDARIAAAAIQASQIASINLSAIPNSLINDINTRLNQSQVDARVRAGVADWAEATNQALVPNNKLPSTALRTDSSIESIAEEQVETWARTDNLDTIPMAKIPTDIARTSAVEVKQDAITTTNKQNNRYLAASGTGQNDFKWVDAPTGDGTGANVPSWVTNTGETIPDNKIAANITRDSELGTALNAKQNILPTVNKQTGYILSAVGTDVDSDNPTTDFAWIPAPGGTTGGLNQAQVDARVQAGVEDWAETGNTDPIPASKLTNAGEGVTGGSLANGTLTLNRTSGTPITITGFLYGVRETS